MIKCKRCGCEVRNNKRGSCPRCFEIFDEEGVDFEIVEEAEANSDSPVTKSSPKKQISKKPKPGIIIGRIVFTMAAVIVFLAFCLTITGEKMEKSYINITDKIAAAFETADASLYIGLFNEDYNDYMSQKYGGKKNYEKSIKAWLDREKADNEKTFGENFTVKAQIQTVEDCTSGEITDIAKNLPYAINSNDIYKAQKVNVLYVYSGNGKTLKYSKSLTIARVKDKWYILECEQ